MCDQIERVLERSDEVAVKQIGTRAMTGVSRIAITGCPPAHKSRRAKRTTVRRRKKPYALWRSRAEAEARAQAWHWD